MNPREPAVVRPVLAQRALAAKSSIIREILKITQRPEIISFAGGLPSPDSFPVQELRAACDEVLRADGKAALQYSTTEGHAPLREWIAAREAALGMPTSPEQVLIVGGSQQGLDLVGKAVIDPGSTVLVESPTYLGALQAFAQFEPEFVALPADAHGLAVDAIEASTLNDARFVYVMPTFQNPTGLTLSVERRAALAELAREHDVWLVEDDPYGELWYRSAPPPSLRAYAPERTIRLGSLSKVLAPGLRLGFLIAPADVIDVLVRIKQATDLHTSTLTQRAATHVLASGLLQTHLPEVRALYADRCAVMLNALRTSFPAGVRWTEPDGGMFVWVELPPSLDAGKLLPLAIERKVAFVPGEPFYAATPQRNRLRLSFVTVAPDRIRKGVEILGALLREYES